MTRRALAVALALALTVLVAGCGASRTGTPTHSAPDTASQPLTTVTQPVARPHHPRRRRDPGTLPQTDALPSANTPAFHAEMAALWEGVRTGDSAAARAAFFPEGAYVQVKAIPDSRGDYVTRLLGGYARDIAAAHALVAAHTAPARLLHVAVPGAHWVPPDVCANRVGYYEVPNARVVYAQAGVVRSFGIASMISWRGVWYVVHLGAVVPASASGTVDDPEVGPGVSAPSSTC